MSRDGGTAIEPGIVARIAAGVRYAVTGRAPGLGTVGGTGGDTAAWFGPLDPLPPLAPPAVTGRQFDYPSGYNLVTQPRPHEPTSFHQLRGLADGYDLLRLVIETRKDQIARLNWTIRSRGAVHAGAESPRADAVRDFLAYPDREHAWDAWLRMLLEDLLVIDAPTLYPRLDNGGRLHSLEPIDGATIKRVLDDWGRTPLPPAPAYQQVLKGLPAIDYAADELLYLPRNPRTNRVYGFSPVEQIVMTVNIALRRQLHQLQYYTEGTVPEALIGVPETWTPDQIAQFQNYWDALLTDDTATRRHARFVPATISKSFVQTKDAALKDDYDEWLARIVCYAFSVSSQWAVKAMNRATAETAQQQADDEGLAPLLAWVKGAIDRILRRCFAAPDLEFHWLAEEDEDGAAQAQVDQIYLQTGVKSINEVRAEQGLAPVAGGEAPLVQSGGSLVPLAQAAKGPQPSPATPVAEYAPDQPRDDHGRWTTGGGGSGASPDIHVADPAADQRQKPIQLADSGQFATDASPTRVAAAEEDDERERSDESPDPLGETRTAFYNNMKDELLRLEPDNKFSAEISDPDKAPDGAALARISAELQAARQRVADRIAIGHAYDMHADEFGFDSPTAMSDLIVETLENPSARIRTLARGNTAYYDRNTNTIVIVDPDTSDGGTAYRPRHGEKDFDELY
jgi:hypothetical protein